VRFRKRRLRNLLFFRLLPPSNHEPSQVAIKVIAGIYDGITTREMDKLAAETCESRAAARGATCARRHPCEGCGAELTAAAVDHRPCDAYKQKINNF